MPRYSDAQIAEALHRTHGQTVIAARLLGCAPLTVRRRLAKSAALREVQEDARGYMLDMAELRLLEACDRGEPWAVQFYLRTQAKDRGYGTSVAVSGYDGGPVQVQQIRTIVVEAPPRRAD